MKQLNPHSSEIRIKGILKGLVTTTTPNKTSFSGLDKISNWWDNPKTQLYELRFLHHNAYVNRGMHILLNRAFRTTENQITHMFISTSSDAVTGATTTVGGTSVFRAFDSTPSAAAALTISALATFTKANIDTLAAAIRKIGMAASSTDAGTDLVDVIGGTGVAPYDEDISINLLSADNVTLTPQIDTILTAV